MRTAFKDILHAMEPEDIARLEKFRAKYLKSVFTQHQYPDVPLEDLLINDYITWFGGAYQVYDDREGFVAMLKRIRFYSMNIGDVMEIRVMSAVTCMTGGKSTAAATVTYSPGSVINLVISAITYDTLRMDGIVDGKYISSNIFYSDVDFIAHVRTMDFTEVVKTKATIEGPRNNRYQYIYTVPTDFDGELGRTGMVHYGNVVEVANPF